MDLSYQQPTGQVQGSKKTKQNKGLLLFVSYHCQKDLISKKQIEAM